MKIMERVLWPGTDEETSVAEEVERLQEAGVPQGRIDRWLQGLELGVRIRGEEA